MDRTLDESGLIYEENQNLINKSGKLDNNINTTSNNYILYIHRTYDEYFR